MNRVALGSSQCPACAVFAPIAIEGYAIVAGVVAENRPGGKSAGPSGGVASGRWSCRLLCERWSNWFGRFGTQDSFAVNCSSLLRRYTPLLVTS